VEAGGDRPRDVIEGFDRPMNAMNAIIFAAAALGAVGVYLALPKGAPTPAKLGGLIGLAALGGLLGGLAGQLASHPGEGSLPSVYYYLFTLISAVAAVRVITHPRPVYSALYFVLVILSTSGMLVLLEAEFMAFAMIIIYAGAILVTYMFVIMLATLPQSSTGPDNSPYYDRAAREPMLSVVMGFALVATIGSIVFSSKPVERAHAEQPGPIASRDIPRKFNLVRLEKLLATRGKLESGERIFSHDDIDLSKGVIHVRRSLGSVSRQVELSDELLNQFVANMDYVGLNLFKGHVLGIELAGVILLLSMVGAIVIARRPAPEFAEHRTVGTEAGGPGHD
jgi:NADH-quinone oxidoreductase subunit J